MSLREDLRDEPDSLPVTDTVDDLPSKSSETPLSASVSDAAEDHASQVHQRALDALSKLNPRQAKALVAYADPDSPTFGNKQRSYQASYRKAESGNGATVSMGRLLESAKVKPALSAVLEENSVDPLRRVRRLSQVVWSDTPEEEHILNADGEVVRTLQRPIPTRDRLKAIDLLNKLDGSYAEAEQAVSVQAEAAKQLIRANRHLLSDPG